MKKNNRGSKTKELWGNPEYRAKMKKAHLGGVPWNKGKKTGLVPKTAFKKGQTSSRKGTKASVETIKKMSLSRKGIPLIKNRGENNWNWKGGMTPLQNRIRQCFRYRQWRSDVFERDDFTCQKCEVRGGVINADHIKAFSVIVRENDVKTLEDALVCEELWNINNGQTLCASCHIKTDTYGGKKK